jgi:hypothetical protein
LACTLQSLGNLSMRLNASPVPVNRLGEPRTIP